MDVGKENSILLPGVPLVLALFVTLSTVSAGASAAQSCAQVFADHAHFYLTVSHRADDGSYFIMKPPEIVDRVDLTTPFAYYEMFSDFIAPIASQIRGPVEVVAAKAKHEWEIRKDDLYYSIFFGAMRGPLFEAGKLLHPERDFDQNLMRYLIRPIQRILAPLYISYGKQGPERAELLPRIMEQDWSESGRFIRFVISRYVKPMGYLQILLSRNPSEKLHVAEWGDQVAEILRQEPGEVIGELGRLHIIHPNEYRFDYHESVMSELKNEAGKLKTNRAITEMLMQKAFSWANSDARLDRLIFQINEKVERVMLLNELPLHLGKRLVVEKTWKTGELVREVIYSFDRKAMLLAEEYLMARVIIGWLESVESQPLFYQASTPTIQPTFQNNEFSVFKRLGLYPHLFNGRELPEVIIGDKISIVMGLEQIESAKKHLQERLRVINGAD